MLTSAVGTFCGLAVKSGKVLTATTPWTVKVCFVTQTKLSSRHALRSGWALGSGKSQGLAALAARRKARLPVHREEVEVEEPRRPPRKRGETGADDVRRGMVTRELGPVQIGVHMSPRTAPSFA